MPGRRSWKLEDAKARFSEVVRLAHSEGPQRVTVRGRESVVVISVEELDRLTDADRKMPLTRFLADLGRNGLADLDLTREEDRGRELPL